MFRVVYYLENILKKISEASKYSKEDFIDQELIETWNSGTLEPYRPYRKKKRKKDAHYFGHVFKIFELIEKALERLGSFSINLSEVSKVRLY